MTNLIRYQVIFVVEARVRSYHTQPPQKLTCTARSCLRQSQTSGVTSIQLKIFCYKHRHLSDINRWSISFDLIHVDYVWSLTPGGTSIKKRAEGQERNPAEPYGCEWREEVANRDKMFCWFWRCCRCLHNQDCSLLYSPTKQTQSMRSWHQQISSSHLKPSVGPPAVRSKTRLEFLFKFTVRL